MRTGITLIELAWFFGMVFAGLWCGSWLGSHYGKIGLVVGFIIGFAAVIPLPKVLWKFLGIWYYFRPFRPICKNGKCCNDDYEFIEFRDDGVVVRCNCGTKYFQKCQRFMEILDDGSTRPYMIRRGIFSRWETDK